MGWRIRADSIHSQTLYDEWNGIIFAQKPSVASEKCTGLDNPFINDGNFESLFQLGYTYKYIKCFKANSDILNCVL